MQESQNSNHLKAKDFYLTLVGSDKIKANEATGRLRADKEFRSWLEQKTKFLERSPSVSARLYAVFHELKENPKCSCQKPVGFRNIKQGFLESCSRKCSSQKNFR